MHAWCLHINDGASVLLQALAKGLVDAVNSLGDTVRLSLPFTVANSSNASCTLFAYVRADTVVSAGMHLVCRGLGIPHQLSWTLSLFSGASCCLVTYGTGAFGIGVHHWKPTSGILWESHTSSWIVLGQRLMLMMIVTRTQTHLISPGGWIDVIIYSFWQG